MSRVPLSQVADWSLVDESQDLRGRPLLDERGNALGTVVEMLVNTETSYVDAIVLDSGQEVSADDIEIGEGVVFLRHAGAGRTAATSGGAERVDSLHVPVIEEQVRVGKRQVEGGVRVATRVEQSPVEQPVTLRRETLNVERTPVHRPASSSDYPAFKEATIVVRTREQRPVVEKLAFVVEEIHIHKGVEERTEVIRETVRRTEVDIQEIQEGEESNYGRSNTRRQP